MNKHNEAEIAMIQSIGKTILSIKWIVQDISLLIEFTDGSTVTIFIECVGWDKFALDISYKED